MNRVAIFILVCLLFGAWPAVSGSPDREYLAELIARGYSTDDESLRALVRSETELEDARYKAAFLLAYRGVKSASEDIRSALASPYLSDRGLSRMATALAVLALLQDDRWCGTGCGANPDFSGLQAEIARVWSKEISETWNDFDQRRIREREAYAADAPKYVNLIAEIRARCTPPGGNP